MKQKTLNVFNRLEHQRSDVIRTISNLSEEERRYRPGAGEWNLLQVMRHLITAEQQSLIYIQRNIGRAEDVPRSGLGSAFRHLLLKIALTLPLKFKAPKIAEVSEENPDFETMKAEWDAVRNDLQELIHECSDDTLAKALYRHPRAGYLNIKQALEFMETHITHHQKQIKRIMSDSSFHSSFPG